MKSNQHFWEVATKHERDEIHLSKELDLGEKKKSVASRQCLEMHNASLSFKFNGLQRLSVNCTCLCFTLLARHCFVESTVGVIGNMYVFLCRRRGLM